MRALILCVVEVRRWLGVISDSSPIVIKILFIFLWCLENDLKLLVVDLMSCSWMWSK